MIKIISVDEIRKIWKELWPNGFEVKSDRIYMGGYNPLYNESELICFGYFADDKIVGVNSILKTDTNQYRSRGLYVLPEYRKRGIGYRLLRSSIIMAKNFEADYIWSMPRESAINVYIKDGFKQTSDFF